MLIRAIILSTLFFTGSAIADSVHEARNVMTANGTAVADGGNSTFSTVTVIVNATAVYNVTEAIPTPTNNGTEVWTTIIAAPMNTSVACFCDTPVTIAQTENQNITVWGPTFTNITNITVTALPAAATAANITATVFPTAAAAANITVTVLPTAAAAANGTVCPCQVVVTNQTVLPTTQAVGAAVAGETPFEANKNILNANSGIMEIASIQFAAISIFFGLVGAGATLL
ncbi:hypothetical protein FRC01_009838 [Tulasnella sp. 417]|nr:hypothetical protein FRC01_009838 [Tulasnella sp. 417]